jgi:hypothetical protein
MRSSVITMSQTQGMLKVIDGGSDAADRERV